MPLLEPQYSLTGKTWKVAEETLGDCSSSRTLAERLAEKRGIDLSDTRSADHMLSADIFLDFPRALERMKTALSQGERIGVFSDYDCDGITGAAQMIRFLRRAGRSPVVDIPDRAEHGYGLSEVFVQKFKAQGVSLLLLIDVGITAHEAVSSAKAQGIDAIILDHHAFLGAPPVASATLHPALATSFPYAYPCASGVVHLFIKGCVDTLRIAASRVDAQEDIALAAIGTVADLVPLTGWNRAIVRDGLTSLQELRTGPVASLAKSVRAGEAPLTSRDIGFRIAPRINAAGRMDDPKVALEALLGSKSALASLAEFNTARQELMAACTDDAIAQIADAELSPFIVLAEERFTPGIIGLIAGKLVERFGHPALVASVIGGECRGSIRGIPDVHVLDALRSAASLFSSFGGHAQAAGCSFPRQNLDAVVSALSTYVTDRVPAHALIPTITIDATLCPDDVSLAFVEGISALEPFGQGNPEPRFMIPCSNVEGMRRVGADGSHLQCTIGGLPAIGFRFGQFIDHAAAGPLDISGRLIVETWQGYRKAKMLIDDMRMAQARPTIA